MADTDIFERLKQDHERQRDLLSRIDKATGDEREELFRQFTLEAKSHASAEEQALYSTMMRKPQTTDETRHSVAEHHEIEEALNDIAATELESSEWVEKFRELKHDFLHHIGEEEEDHFPDFAKYLTEADEQHMRAVFDARKEVEKAQAEVTPEKKEDAKE